MNNKFSSKNMSTVKFFSSNNTNNIGINNLTNKDLADEINEDKLLDYYAIPILFDESESLLEDFEEKAEYYISTGQEIPDDIKQKLIETLDERKERNKQRGWN